MSEDNKNTETSTAGKMDDITHKKKRIKRMKTAILITIIILFLLPTILCIILGIQLSKLQSQVDNLLSTYSINTEDNEKRKLSGKYAYASTDGLIHGDDFEEYDDENQHDDDTTIQEDVNSVINNDITDGTVDKSSDASNIDNIITDSDDTDIISGSNEADATNTSNNTNEADAVNTSNTSNDEKIDNTDESSNINTVNDSGTDLDTDIIDDTHKLESDTKGIYYGKKVYLTFDDGPSEITDIILDTLNKYNVKATFFVIGQVDEASKNRYRRIVEDGHILAMHSYSHKYSEIYKSIEDFDKDFTKLWKLLYDTTGYTPTLYRFPGGSLMKSKDIDTYNNYLKAKGMTYLDWNVVNGDGEGIDYTEEQMIDKVLDGVAKKKTSIILMHDGWGKDKTAATLPKILDALISGGAELLPMDESVPLIQQVKANSLE